MEQEVQPHYRRVALAPGEAWPAPTDDKIVVIEKTIAGRLYTAAVYEADIGGELEYVRCQLLDNPYDPPPRGPVKAVKTPELQLKPRETLRLLLCRDTIWEIPREDFDQVPWLRFREDPPDHQPQEEPDYAATQTGPMDDDLDQGDVDEDDDGFYC